MQKIENLKNKDIFILSPHFDDAILSCGSLLSKLVKKNNVTIVNIFTKANEGQYTLSAKQFLKYSGNYKSANKLFTDREQEDKLILSKIKVKIINLGIIDALFRKNKKINILEDFIPEINHVYPTYRWHVVKSIKNNDPAISQLETKLKKIIKRDEVVFAPYGIGKHVDHQITRLVSQKLFDNTILYSDFPYNVRTSDYGSTPNGFKCFKNKINLKVKSKLIMQYKNQFLGLFPDAKVPKHNEVYFIKK